MKTNDVIHGFRVEYSEELPEISATLYRMTYEKNGADLVWLKRDDDNKTFAIAFKTIPSDHTGVFHILEHSVLNGSKKYPVKEPFVELLKGSMSTFLNAFTFPDKTMYPVSSRNPKDFLNLVDVYMDAVLHPLSISDPHAFRQEGWHYELESPDDSLRCNGVVYNEMKGAFASPDSVLTFEMGRQLFPDTCYGFESGGHPEHIPELTYERYLDGHHRFYHPSNSRIILDGDLDIDAVLAKLDSFLCDYDRLDVDSDIAYQKPVRPEEKIAYYEIGAEEDPANKAMIATGWVFGDYRDLEKSLAFSVLDRVLAGSNEAPLSKALLDAGLCEDVYFSKNDGIQQMSSVLVVKNCDPEKRGEIWKLVDETVKKLCDGGLDRKRLHSALSRMEFAMREKDYGGMPKGLVYAMTTLESWLYGGNPAQNLCCDAVFASLRKKIDEGWFEELLGDIMLRCEHTARVCLLPSKTLGEEKAAAEAERLKKIKAELSDSDIKRIMDEFAALRARQDAPDSAEALNSLPKLSVSDIPTEAQVTELREEEVDGIRVMHVPVETEGITYLTLFFDISDIPAEKLSETAFFASLVGQTATEHFSAIELQSELQGCLGRFSVGADSYAHLGDLTAVTPYIKVKIALLDGMKDDAVRLTEEILNRSDFSDKNYVYNILRQNRIALEQGIAMSGDSFAAMRTNSQCSAKGAVGERFHGISLLRWFQSADSDFETKGEALCADLGGHMNLFSKERLTIGVTGPLDREFISKIISVLGSGKIGERVKYVPNPKIREGFVIPAEIGFAARSSNLILHGSGYTGAARVAAQFLTYEYLWNTVRVKGGAYGTHMTMRIGGDVSMTSYRDPSPSRSLETFGSTADVLREFCASKGDLEKYIIGTVSAIEPVMTPQSTGDRAMEYRLVGRTEEDIRRERREILGTTYADIEAFSHILDTVLDGAGTCVVGGKAALDACGDKLDKVESIA